MADLDDEELVTFPGAPGPVREPTSVGEILDELTLVIEHAKSMPLSSSAIVARDEVLALLEEARAGLPTELQRARRLLQDADEIRRRAELEANELLDEARSQAGHLVQRTEVVRQARTQADRIVADAESEARRIRHEADDYVDRKLASFEIVLDRTVRTVQAGRSRLGYVPGLGEEPPEAPEGSPGAGGEEGFFDQDLT